MEQDEKRERAIQNIADMLIAQPFTFEFVVKNKPKGIKVIYEVTQSEMDEMLRKENERN